MAKNAVSIEKQILQGALAAVLIVAGLSVFFPSKGDEMMRAIGGVFGDSDVRNVIMYILAIIEIAAGILLVADFFNVKALARIDGIALLVVIVAWCVFIAIADVMPLLRSRISFIPWLGSLAQHILVLATMLIVRKQA